jgi:hypothetical protein
MDLGMDQSGAVRWSGNKFGKNLWGLKNRFILNCQQLAAAALSPYISKPNTPQTKTPAIPNLFFEKSGATGHFISSRYAPLSYVLHLVARTHAALQP